MMHGLTPPGSNPIEEFVKRQGLLVLDGGLATTLEARGCDLDDPLWSAKMLLDAPQLIQAVHREFLEAGADCITAATYQASIPGFLARGLSHARAVELLHTAVRLATDARDAFWSDERNRRGRLKPLVAASVGPYGAYLADGSEYSGRYEVGGDALRTFHRERFSILAESAADLLACETVPSEVEAAVLLELIRETPQRWAWLSFCCRDGERLCDGTRLVDMVGLADDFSNLAALGINCTAPEWVAPLLPVLDELSDRPIVVYPNSGESYDATRRRWAPRLTCDDWIERCRDWRRLGAGGIGGCCRVGPAEVARVRAALV